MYLNIENIHVITTITNVRRRIGPVAVADNDIFAVPTIVLAPFTGHCLIFSSFSSIRVALVCFMCVFRFFRVFCFSLYGPSCLSQINDDDDDSL